MGSFPAVMGSWELKCLTQSIESGIIFKFRTGKRIKFTKTPVSSQIPRGSGSWEVVQVNMYQILATFREPNKHSGQGWE